MGTNFCNINVYGISLAAASEAIPQFDCYTFTPDWVTVVSDAFQWGSTQAFAQKISKTLNASVLSTEYFDDDYVEFAIFEAGKSSTRHVPVAYEGLSRKAGNPASVIRAFHLDIFDEPLCKKIFALKDCEMGVCLMESLLGCPIWGVDSDFLPTKAPSRKLVEEFGGGKSDIAVSVTKNPTRKDAPSYLPNDEGMRRIQGEFSVRTIMCYTNNCEHVINCVRTNYMEYIREGILHRSALQDYYVQILCTENAVSIQGIPFGCTDSCAPDFAKDFRCLVAVCSLDAFSHLGVERRTLDCAFAYGKKLLCFGQRGKEAKCNKVLGDMALESPFLSLPKGVLVSGFEMPAFWDAVDALEGLLRSPLYPIQPEQYELLSEENHLRILTVRR